MQSRLNFRFLVVSMLHILCYWGDACTIRADTPVQRSIVVQNYYFALPGKAEEVYQWRLHASDVRARLGLPRGRVLRRVPVGGDAALSADLPDVVWECEYASREAQSSAIARLDRSPEFAEVEKHMDTLLRNFQRAVFEVSR